MDLTDHQLKVARHCDNHALCIAVAGSGKTTTLAHLILNLLAMGSDPRRVMVMMFNKSAQLDFTAKLQKLTTQTFNGQNHPLNSLPVPEIRTYHSTGLRLLKKLEQWGVRGGFDYNPMSDKEIELKIRELILKLAPDSLQEKIKSDTARYIEAAISFIEQVKSSLNEPDIVLADSDYPDSLKFFITLFHEFEQWRLDNRRITFTDMLYDTVKLLMQHPEHLTKVSNKMQFIVVDEYQDTSTLQHHLTRIIAGERARVIAVGDPDQTIYEFAGANINNILQYFEQDFTSTGLVEQLTIPHTFRYGHSIALAASHLIARNKDRKDVICLAHENNTPSDIELIQSDQDETKVLLVAIRNQLSSTSDPFAILVRVWAQAVPLELALLSEGIQYHNEGPSLFERPEIVSLIAALELSSGQFQFLDVDGRAKRLYQLFTLPHLGIKTQIINELIAAIQMHGQDIGKVMANSIELIRGISDYQRKKLYNRAKILHNLELQGQKKPPAELLQDYIRSAELKESLQSMSLNEQRTEEQLLALDGFLQWLRGSARSSGEAIELIRQLRDRKKQGKQSKNRAQLTISSCHRAKGLEWPAVMIPGLTARYWPFERSDSLSASITDIESERRLLYVAMTRARKQLFLFSCPGNLEPGSHNWNNSNRQTVSRFLKEMQLDHSKTLAEKLNTDSIEPLQLYLAEHGLTQQSRRYLDSLSPVHGQVAASAPSRKEILAKQRQAKAKNQDPGYRAARSVLFNSNESSMPWQENSRLRHSIFGEGKVIEVNDNNFVVLFDREYGVKRFACSEQVLHLFEPA
ncbi:hypothetical protein EOPP23_17470 [Endozoicomonas sp. OPT23]|uniref:ATP-dependent helicase n=1 Tax=Endozoicomonas sp. OPT23 TaxID=2072845 RepID=UPI00129B47FB|nr:ATP-dependent helicase [Endozoicomonas sp. OPT23]MRI34774.1 hypothetical protein [Endozoicomonas sp. OPT23]